MPPFRLILAITMAALWGAHSMSDRTVLESLPDVPQGWTRLRDASKDQPFTLRIALHQPNLDALADTLFAVSDPQSPMYGNHLSRDEVNQMMKPPRETARAVLGWLEESGLLSGDIFDEGDWIVVKTNAGQVNKLLDTQLGIYQRDDVVKIRALEYSVPAHIAEHVRMISPMIRFGHPKSMRSTIHSVEQGIPIEELYTVPFQGSALTLNASCNSSITPDCLRALYKIGNTTAQPAKGSQFAVAGFLEQWAKFDMLAAFGAVYAPYITDKQTLSIQYVNGGQNEQSDTSHDAEEANLDVQYAVSLSYPIPVSYISTGGRGPLVPDLDSPDMNDITNEPYVEFLTNMLQMPNEALPQTLSISYGENEQELPREYSLKVCEMFGQLGLRGVSVLIASGDEGPGISCQTNDGKNATRFMPVFPAACPYVTSVGGTTYVDPEEAVSFSSGGFSEIWPQPDYQVNAVTTYLHRLGGRWDGLYNRTGRGFPDVAAQGKNFHIFDTGSDKLISGTSASAPTFAGVIALLNDARLASGQKPLGFLNPWLYNNTQMLTDITKGGSKGCTGSSRSWEPGKYVPYAGWNATEGWDPVTGLGTPLYDKMLQAIGTIPLTPYG